MNRKNIVIVMSLCLAIIWVSEGFAQQYHALKKAQKSQVFEATLDFIDNGGSFNLFEEEKAILKKGKLSIKLKLLNDNCAYEITTLTRIIFKVSPSKELLFNRITVTMPFLDDYVKGRLTDEFTAAMDGGEIDDAKRDATLNLTNREGDVTSTWNILGWHIESFDFPTFDSKDDSQLIQQVTIRAEKIVRADDDDDNNDNE